MNVGPFALLALPLDLKSLQGIPAFALLKPGYMIDLVWGGLYRLAGNITPAIYYGAEQVCGTFGIIDC